MPMSFPSLSRKESPRQDIRLPKKLLNQISTPAKSRSGISPRNRVTWES